MDVTTPPDMYKDREAHVAHSMSMEECIENCLACAQLCERLIPHCFSLGGEHASSHHIRLLMDCADICATSARFMLRQSDLHFETCNACAAICDACAKDCEHMTGEDDLMRECAEHCRKCAETCRSMVAHHMA